MNEGKIIKNEDPLKLLIDGIQSYRKKHGIKPITKRQAVLLYEHLNNEVENFLDALNEGRLKDYLEGF